MNGYQRKRIDGNLRPAFIEKLLPFELKFLNTLKDKPDDYELSDKQNHVLNQIARRVGG